MDKDSLKTPEEYTEIIKEAQRNRALAEAQRDSSSIEKVQNNSQNILEKEKIIPSKTFNEKSEKDNTFEDNNETSKSSIENNISANQNLNPQSNLVRRGIFFIIFAVILFITYMTVGKEYLMKNALSLAVSNSNVLALYYLWFYGCIVVGILGLIFIVIGSSRK